MAETVTLADQIENSLPPSVTAQIEKTLGLEEQARRLGRADPDRLRAA